MESDCPSSQTSTTDSTDTTDFSDQDRSNRVGRSFEIFVVSVKPYQGTSKIMNSTKRIAMKSSFFILLLAFDLVVSCLLITIKHSFLVLFSHHKHYKHIESEASRSYVKQ